MATTTIDQLPAAAGMSDNDEIPIWQGGQTLKATRLQALGRALVRPHPVGNRNLWCQNGQSSATTLTAVQSYYQSTNLNGTWRQRFYLANDVWGLQGQWVNTSQDPGAGAGLGAETPPWQVSDLGGQLQVRAALECTIGATSGLIIPFTFAGQATGAVDEGGILTSDPINVALLKAASPFAYIRTWASYPSGKFLPLFKEQFGGDGEGYVDNTDLTRIGSAGGFVTTASNLFGPVCLLGYTAAASPIVLGALGDSILAGAKNRQVDGTTVGVATTTNDFSFLDYGNGLSTPMYALIKACHGGLLAQAEAQNLPSNNGRYFGRRRGMLNISTHVVLMLGTNDINNGRTAVQLEGDITAIIASLKLSGKSVILCPLPPRTTSSDNWVTVSNQTKAATESVRVAFNDWVRSSGVSAGGADYILDPWALNYEVNASNVPTVDGGFIAVNGVTNHVTWDGTPPAGAGNHGYADVPTATFLAALTQ